MIPRLTAACTLALLTLCALCGDSLADECQPHWDNLIGQPGTSGFVGGIAEFNGYLYVGGAFTHAGATEVNFIARWDHSDNSWSDIAGGANDWTRAFIVFDDGSGDGPALYVGGHFNQIGGIDANHIARWDGTSWSAVGAGFDHNVQALAVFDDGSGPALIAGGQFSSTGDAPVNNIARWNPATQTWLPLGSGAASSVWGLAVWDDGSGNGDALYVVGSFASAGDVAGTSRVAKWDGTEWAALATGTSGGSPNQANDVTAFGDHLYVGGFFESAGNAPNTSRIARWNGSSWESVGGGIDADWVTVLQTFDDGDGEALYAGGTFSAVGGIPANRIAKWNGSSWSPLDAGVTGFNVAALAAFDAGNGPDLYVGGPFQSAGGLAANNIAIWRGCALPDDPTPDCPGDLTGSGGVGVADLLQLLSCWGPLAPGSGCEAADLTGNGSVGVSDLLDLLSQWGPCP